MKILGIETSCDETAAAVIDVQGEKQKAKSIKILSNVVSSQVKLHAKYGGVVPNLAAREHVKNIEHVFKLALKEAGVKNTTKEIDLIAVTRGPGLGPSLLVGLAFARAIAWKYQKPIVGVNHLEGHIYSNWLSPVAVNTKSLRTKIKDFQRGRQMTNSKQIPNSKFQIQNENIFPILNLIVSGGHTELVLMKGHGKYKIVGETLDDAVGEAFDKVARLLGLGYPGGPAISQHAEEWSETRNKRKETSYEIKFPRPMMNSKNVDFSYSGLKTSVLYKVRDLKSSGANFSKNLVDQICYEFQNAALEVLVSKTIRAAEKYKVKAILLSGGVSANKTLRQMLELESKKIGVNYSQPDFEFTTDNATMIAAAGYFNYTNNKKIKTAWDAVEMDANLGFR